MQLKIADVVQKLPLPDKEKLQKEKPLLMDMEDWLKCELCKKPVIQPPPGQLPKPWP